VTVLVVGLSHRSAPVPLLERVAIPGEATGAFAADAAAADHVAEAVVVSTCNRVETYAAVDRFHGGVAALSEQLARRAGVSLDELAPHLYVHFDERAVQHLFSVVCGLDSMVVGETQILGQVRQSLRQAQEHGSVGKVLGGLFQDALRVGKRAHAETGIDHAGSRLVAAALGLAEQTLGPVESTRVLLVGAGSMSALAGATLQRAGARRFTVANRTLTNARRLAERLAADAVGLDHLAEALAEADLVVSSTGAVGYVVGAADVAAAGARRATSPGRPQVLLDLALPRDVDPAVESLDGVRVIDLDRLGSVLADGETVIDVEAVRAIVTEEVALHAASRAIDRVEPTVVALRRRAADVVASELARLDAKLPGLDPAARAEVERTVNRTVDKLLHEPTVRIKELAAFGDAGAYAQALHALFDLTPEALEAVERVDAVLPSETPR